MARDPRDPWEGGTEGGREGKRIRYTIAGRRIYSFTLGRGRFSHSTAMQSCLSLSLSLSNQIHMPYRYSYTCPRTGIQGKAVCLSKTHAVHVHIVQQYIFNILPVKYSIHFRAKTVNGSMN